MIESNSRQRDLKCQKKSKKITALKLSDIKEKLSRSNEKQEDQQKDQKVIGKVKGFYKKSSNSRKSFYYTQADKNVVITSE